MSDVITLSSPQGQVLLEEARRDLYLQPHLLQVFSKQTGASNCGIHTLALILSACKWNATGDGSGKKGALYKEAGMFDLDAVKDVVGGEAMIEGVGITMEQFAHIIEGLSNRSNVPGER